MLKNIALLALLTLTLFGASLVGAPDEAMAQTQPTYGSATLHPHTITLPDRAFYRGEMKFQITVKDTVAWRDTLSIPGYDSTCTVQFTRVTKGARAPGVIDNSPWLTYLVPKRTTLIFNFQKADTLTLDMIIKKPY